MEGAYMGHQYWIGNFKVLNRGLLKQIGQLPQGARRDKIEGHLRAVSELLENLERDPTSDSDLNLKLFQLSAGTAVPEEEHAVHV